MKNEIIVEFSLNKHPLSKWIPKVMQGEYSHVSIVWNEHTLFSARFKGGVGFHKRDLNQYVKQEYWAIKANISEVKRKIKQTEGKRYDNKGALRFFNLFFLFSQDKEKYFCSELAFTALFPWNPYFTSDFSTIDPSTIDVLAFRQILQVLKGLPNSPVRYLGTTLTSHHH